MSRRSLRRTWSAVVLAAAVCYLLVSLQFSDGASRGEVGDRRQHPLAVPFVMFRTLAPADVHGRVALLGLAPSDSARQITNLSCSRVHYAGGRGLCVVQESIHNAAVYAAYIFDETLTRGRRIELSGIPTRVRVAPNGRRAAITTYGEEETPDGERLATHAIVVDMRSGRVIADLREFRIQIEGLAPLSGPVDIGSVAFERDGDRFFATLSTVSQRYLVAGSIAERRLTLLRSGVAAEALSPDGRQLVVKKSVGDRGYWQLAVIDLRTWSERNLLQGPHSVDDQVEWLDEDHVVYHDADEDSTSLWILPVDGVHGPRVLVKDAYSAAVQR